jgi:hypothetical protein
MRKIRIFVLSTATISYAQIDPSSSIGSNRPPFYVKS